MRKISTLVLLFFTINLSFAQMSVDGNTLYGNEWIDYNTQYLKIVVEEDGLYRVSYQDLIDNGFSSNINGEELMLVNNGQEVPLYVPNSGSWSNGDYLFFYGRKNDGEIDRFHYSDWEEEQLNPKYSSYTDQRAYFLSQKSGTHLRFSRKNNNLNGNLPEKEDFYMHEEEQVFGESHWGPTAPSLPDASFSSFVRTEGFGTRLKLSHRLTFNVSNVFNTPAASPNVRIRTGSNAQFSHIIHVSVNDFLLEIDEYSGNKVRNYDLDFDYTHLKATTNVDLEGKAISDLFCVASASLFYPREFNARNATSFKFNLPANIFDKYYEIDGFTASSENLLLDLTNHTYLIPQVENQQARFLIDALGSEESEMLLINVSEAVKEVVSIESKRYENIDALNPEYLIISSKVLNNAENGSNPIEDYASFRSSNEGGGYKVGVVDVEDIYDQFGYGIKGHSYAMKNFAQYVKSKWMDFQMVFLIGKALDYSKRNKSTTKVSLVATYGHPGSDNLMFADPELTYPFVGLGRLAAVTQEDVSNYLRKARIHADLTNVENLSFEERVWRKNVIHLSGGDPGIQEQLYNHLNQMKDIVENSAFGASVTTYRKTSADPVQTALSQQILENIDNGISLLTFFGHSSAGGFDFSVEDPTKYSNEGKLPLILSMGCYSGDIHETAQSLSEQMILTPEKGAIAFVASSGPAFPTPLSTLGKDFYDKISNNFYGRPIGLALAQMAKDLYDPVSIKVQTLQEQNTLHGDPAISLYYAEGADYVVDFTTMSTGSEVVTRDPNIVLEFDIVNLGLGVLDSIDNLLIHTYADQVDTIYFRSAAPFNRESVTLEIPNPGINALGKNLFNIVLDYNNRISEVPSPSAEENNDLSVAWNNEGYCFFVLDNSAFPVYPLEFAIVNDKDLKLVSSSTNAFANKDYYIIQIDTTENFDSPLLETGEVHSYPGNIQYDPQMEFENNVVYYWRISPKAMFNTTWNYSSFIYLENSSEGWNQSHLYQWEKDDYNNYSYDSLRRKFEFAVNLNDVRVVNGAFPTNVPQITTLNNPSSYLPFLGDGEIPAGVYISVFDGNTGLPWINKPSRDGGQYDSELYTLWAQTFPNFPYRTKTAEERAKAINFLENVIPDGSFVIFYTIQRSDFPVLGNYEPNEWASDASTHPDGLDLFSILEGHGAQRIRELETKGPLPYIFAFRKGDSSFPVEELMADDVTEKVELELKILGRWFEGDVTSTTIGPAVEWNRLEWDISELDVDQDDYRLDVLGIRENGQEEIIFPDVDQFSFDISSVNSDIHPYLKLNFYAKDSTGRTSAQMDYWRVLYKQKPEAVLNIEEKFVFNADTLFLGESFQVSTLATNISNTDMDSLLVKYTIVDQNNNEYNEFDKLAPLLSKESVELNFEYDADQSIGINQFRVEINPDMAQPEQFDFNNIGIRDFVVQGDRINPILDVTFDGQRIMDGDVVSPTPRIRIDLKDENEFLMLDDISIFDLSLQNKEQNTPIPIDLSQQNVIFTPADSTTGNHAVLEFLPELEAGEYILYVQAEDASGNLSGDQDIEIEFRVVEESMVSNVLNYPNPFSTSTQFVFTLTGFEIPEVFTIQIMTMTGKVVKEIRKEELGNLRIGINRTDYKWNGTDEFGSKLANGVYLYRVITSRNNEGLGQLYNDDIDGFFKKGFGKLVIMR